jgi:hypothetical protein
MANKCDFKNPKDILKRESNLIWYEIIIIDFEESFPGSFCPHIRNQKQTNKKQYGSKMFK